MTRWQLHVTEWGSCQRCELHTGRKNVVLGRGTLPCDVVFVGEAPGDSEDVSGQPFVGPAGRVLDTILARTVPTDWSWAMTNLVGCIPWEAKRTDDHKPPDDAIRACAPRVADVIDIANPRLIVAVGKLSAGWLDQSRKHRVRLVRPVPIVEIIHPSAILRATSAVQGLHMQRAIVAIRNAVEEVRHGKMIDPPPSHRPIPRRRMPPPMEPADATWNPNRPSWDTDDIPF